MKLLSIMSLLFLVRVLCDSYLIGLQLSVFPKKILEFNDVNIGKISLVRNSKKYYLKKHTKYLFNDNGTLKIGGGKTPFTLDENFFGTQIKTDDLCLTSELGNISLSKCCADDEFCSVRQSFSISYFNNSEESSFAETDGESLIDRLQTKYPNFKDLEEEVLGE
ncbi:hypothetical protein NGRA_0521 [Nosema granulosis]|uniref:Uncharacterized protein n=1 Tax=Nosema granulosis TaxID=83296 RepID=A0A9P6H189_9MICR|nr:hypothetical protein NGRA_0521 [Nosema granulosis]